MNADLQRFVRDALSRGLPRNAIRERLLAAGWRAEEVEAALGAYADVDFPVPVPRRRASLSAREAFLYLVLFATLYITAFNLGLVLFAIVDRWLPDAVQNEYSGRWATEALRNGIAALVIAFPIFLWLSALIGRSLARDPEKRGSGVRKWLTYLTLFVAALVLIGDLTFVLQRLLAGELVARVLWKTVVVFAIAGTIFGHYLGQLRSEEREGAAPRGGRPWLAWAAVLAVVATILAGLFASGSPGQSRQRALDARRAGSLRQIWDQIEADRKARQPFPASLDELAARPSARPPASYRDPETGAPYGYRLVDSVTVELCATFAREDSLATPGAAEGAGRFWRHPQGRHCYTLKAGQGAGTGPAPRPD